MADELVPGVKDIPNKTRGAKVKATRTTKPVLPKGSALSTRKPAVKTTKLVQQLEEEVKQRIKTAVVSTPVESDMMRPYSPEHTPSVRPAYTTGTGVPPLVSAGLVNVLTKLRGLDPDHVDKVLTDLGHLLQMRAKAQTLEARQRYTLMACVQIAQDFETLWDTLPVQPMY